MSQVLRPSARSGLAALALLASTALAPAAQAAAPRDGCYVKWSVRNVRDLGLSTVYPDNPDWKVSGRGPATLTLSKGVWVNNTYSGDFGYSRGGVSGAVGFSVSRTWTTNLSYSIRIPKRKTGTIHAGFQRHGKYYEVWYYNSCWHPAERRKGAGYAYEVKQIVYRQKVR